METGPQGPPSTDPQDTHGHSHEEGRVTIKDTSGSRLLMTLALNFIIPAVQVVGGFVANSMALISDAIHNFSDFTAVLISYVAYRMGQKSASFQNTFGYRRIEIIAALINVAILVGASGFIVYGALRRLAEPEIVKGALVMLIAGVGVLGNGVSAWLLHRDSKHSLNIRGAFLHMLGDLLTSVVVVINGLVLIFKPWYWLDPLLSLMIVLFILKNCWSILKEATAVLMNATPKGLDLEEVREALEQIPGVLGVHYLHAWDVSSTSIAFSCHVVVCEQPISRTEPIAQAIRTHLLERYNIDHPTLQLETNECGDGSTLCGLSCEGAPEAILQME